MTHNPIGHCEDPAHEWRVHLRADYIVEVHAVDEAAAKEMAEEWAANGMYDLGSTAEAIEAWQEQEDVSSRP